MLSHDQFHASAFVGRHHELNLLQKQFANHSASLVVVYGRRRIGKTRLIVEACKTHTLWKFDGIERAPKAAQIRNFLDSLADFSQDNDYKDTTCKTWIQVFKLMDRALAKTPHGHKLVLFLDEFQYMANRRNELVSAVKWAWDNLWQGRADFVLVLCGSIASFMVNKVVKSSSLYGRLTLEMALGPLAVKEAGAFFQNKRSIREICDLVMFCGGVPEYLQKISANESVLQQIAQQAFCKNGYFVGEFDRLFKDIFREEKIYKKIIMALSRHKNLKVPELTKILAITAGGGITEHLNNLIHAGFVQELTPLNRSNDTKLKRYCLSDEYLFFYFKFIYPHLKRIGDNLSPHYGLSVLTGPSYKSWRGLAFERLCLKQVNKIMEVLRIDQLVKNYGPYFTQATNSKEAAQIDLLFDRHDGVITVCEIKHHDSPIGKWVIEEVENKTSQISQNRPNKTIDRILISASGATKDLVDTGYFSRILTLEELFL